MCVFHCCLLQQWYNPGGREKLLLRHEVLLQCGFLPCCSWRDGPSVLTHWNRQLHSSRTKQKYSRIEPTHFILVYATLSFKANPCCFTQIFKVIFCTWYSYIFLLHLCSRWSPSLWLGFSKPLEALGWNWGGQGGCSLTIQKKFFKKNKSVSFSCNFSV